MATSRWKTAAAASILLTAPGCTHTPPLSAPLATALGRGHYVRAHLDRLAPAKVKQFDDARREWLAAVRLQKGTDPWWGTFFEVEGMGFISLRPLVSLEDLGKRTPDSPPGPERIAAMTRYNQLSDEGLVFPHMSQVWALDSDLVYQPPGAAFDLASSPGTGQILFEGLAPGREDEYEAAWKSIHQALASACYPLARFTFSNLYGDGRVVTIWIGPAPAPLEESLAKAVGPDRAADLLRAARAPIVSSETYPLRARPDLSDRSFAAE